ncbi:hypothetical protein C8T65DRAFT_734430 [Cerioporus squamosus]|nr:hypothetical protein C8T65DRAFT_734430 [Cerioporus squamosus]
MQSGQRPLGAPPTFKIPAAPPHPPAADNKNRPGTERSHVSGEVAPPGSHDIRTAQYGSPYPLQPTSIPSNTIPHPQQSYEETTPLIPQTAHSRVAAARQGAMAASQATAPGAGSAQDRPGPATTGANPPAPRHAAAEVVPEGGFKTEFHPHARRDPIRARLDYSQPQQLFDITKVNYEPWRPFATRTDYELAEFMLTSGLNRGQATTLFDILNRIVVDPRQLTVKSYDDIQKAWDSARGKQPAFQANQFTVPYEHGEKTYTFQHRDAWDWAESLIIDPLMCRHFVWHAYKQYKGVNGKWVQFIDEPYTAERLYEFESSLPPDGVPLAFVLYADKTRLSSFGTQQGYPVIARLANLPSSIRNSSGHGGGQIVGFLPVVSDEKEKGKPQFATHKRDVWHEALKYVLKKIAEFSRSGKKVRCGDGILRRFFSLILICVADYEEQAVMTLIRGVNGLFPCPVCLVPAAEQAELGIKPLYPLRTQEQAQSIVMNPSLSDRQKEEKLKKISIRDVENVFWSVVRSDPHETNSFDRLHAYHSGLFAAHLLDEYQKVILNADVTATEMVHDQVDAVPRWANLYHASEVVTFNFADGSKYEALSKASGCRLPDDILIPSTYNVLLSIDRCGLPLLRAMRIYCVLDMYAGLELQTEDRLACFEKNLPRFSAALKLYKLERPQKSWNFPKDHTHQHTPADIRAKGATYNYNTKPSERAHGIIKAIYQERTNFKNVEEQISRIEHQFVVARFTRYQLDFLDKLRAPPAPPPVEDNEPTNLHQFYHVYITPYKYLKISYESVETWKLEVDKLRITANWYSAPRYDWVLFRGSGRGEYRFGQLNSVFTCNVEGTIYPLALVTVYDVVLAPRSRVDHELGLLRIRRCQDQYAGSAFIHLGSIIRGALVVRDYGLPSTYQYRATAEEEKAYARLNRYHGADNRASMDAFWDMFYDPRQVASPFDDRLVIDLVDADMFLRLRGYFNLDT